MIYHTHSLCNICITRIFKFLFIDLNSETYFVSLLTSLSLVNLLFDKQSNASSRSHGHTLPAQGKETSSESGKSLSVTALQRRLSCTSSCVFITTAVCTTHANMCTNVHDHSCVFLACYSSSNSKTAAFGDRRPVKDSC